MVFSSFVFLFCFLPSSLIIYFGCPDKMRNWILVILSLIFYAWGEPKYVLIMIFSIVFDYSNGRLIELAYIKEKNRIAHIVFVTDIVGNLFLLGYFKYADFLIQNVNFVFDGQVQLLNIALPIGISFYTFQTMSYTIDVYRKKVSAQHNIINFATYVTFFPQLIAGPIVQYKTIEKEICERNHTIEDVGEGMFRFCIGLGKKVLLANQIGCLWTEIDGLENLSVASAWLGAIAFTFQIYFDFSGYSDMAIGLGRIFGFHFPENFDFPYQACSITEFWRRWHISLGSWFREYVYIPLGGNRRGFSRQIINLLIVWALTGVWHGASWNFLIWGIYYGIILIFEKYFIVNRVVQYPIWLQKMYTRFWIVVGWMIFAHEDIKKLGTYLKSMFGVNTVLWDSEFLFFLSNNVGLIIILFIFSRQWKSPNWAKSWNGNMCILKPVVAMMIVAISIAFLVAESYNPFLYFRF